MGEITRGVLIGVGSSVITTIFIALWSLLSASGQKFWNRLGVVAPTGERTEGLKLVASIAGSAFMMALASLVTLLVLNFGNPLSSEDLKKLSSLSKKISTYTERRICFSTQPDNRDVCIEDDGNIVFHVIKDGQGKAAFGMIDPNKLK